MTLTQTREQGVALGQSSLSLAKMGASTPPAHTGTSAMPCSTPWLALPQSVRWVQGLGGVGGAKAAWQRLCGGRAWGLTAWYLLGRQGTVAKVAVPAPAFPLALYRRALKCRWCRRAGRCVSRQGMGEETGCAPTPDSGCPFQLGSVARAAPPCPAGLTMKVLGCVCAGAQGTMGKGPDTLLSFLPRTMYPLGPGIKDPAFPRAHAALARVEAGGKEVPGCSRNLPAGS